MAKFSFLVVLLVHLALVSCQSTDNIYTHVDANETGTFFNVTLESPKALKITMYGSITAAFNVTIFCESSDTKFMLRTRSLDTHVAVVAERKIYMFSCANVTDINPYITDELVLKLDGVILGRTNLTFQLTTVYGDDEYVSFVELSANDTDDVFYMYPITVFKIMGPLDHVFRVIIYLFLILSTVGFGVKLDLQVVKECLKKPLAPIIGFVCQYGFMPTVSSVCILYVCVNLFLCLLLRAFY